MLERIIVKWDPPFVLELEDGIAKRGYFGNREDSEVIHTDFSKRLKRELEKYFRGRPTDFGWVRVEYPSKFERILKEVRKIPFGKTVTYGDLAERLETSPRVVGAALRMNKVPVIIPCHRVVAKKGLGGYSYGVEIKKKLLNLEI